VAVVYNRRIVVGAKAICYRCAMPTMLPRVIERKCPVCDGSGHPPVKQPKEPGRRIYPARCERCDGKGWVEAAN
jgi:DnaJ-class molecular chaperone